jgi:PhoPQ-activated pathogenicity-related protein
LPDSSQFYFTGLKGENYLRYLPNTDHSLKGAYVDAAEGALTFYQSILTNTPRPSFRWAFEDDGSIRIKTEAKPAAVTLWQAVNEQAAIFGCSRSGGAIPALI